MPSRAILGLIALLLWPALALAQIPDRAPDLLLTGVLTGADHETYRELPFEPPPGTQRITVAFDYSGRDARTTVDLGLFGPAGFRGWSGGNKASFTVAATDATPSYLPGPLETGVWRLVLGVPNIRPTTRARYEARLWFDGAEAFAGFADAPVADGERWWRGDLHVHSGHSDGACKSRSGAKIACPLFRVLQAAAEADLDFVAVTDHNTVSQAQGLRELQPYFDDLLVIAGREITTFQGHANLFGPVAFVDFRLGGEQTPDLDAMLGQAEAAGGLVSVNHPALPSGEACMGCGWRAETHWSRIAAVEVINGGALALFQGQAENPLDGVAFWQARLDEGHRLTAIAGSDSHDADRPPGEPGAVGRPATVVRAPALSQQDILAAVRAGRVFVDVAGDSGRTLDLAVRAAGNSARMGEDLALPAGLRAEFAAEATGRPGDQIEVLVSGAEPYRLPLSADGPTRFAVTGDGRRGWVRLNLRDSEGRLILIGNPVYLNWR
ncbi:MAG: phosphotransferase [Phenylobacterium sp. RIFCSPHIGHO2_01_FULL_70_10]|nr:MAG: phosphotransferase [Phenylobacterium sp. RIFCSPHIGHO2_01_FULL_70_10]